MLPSLHCRDREPLFVSMHQNYFTPLILREIVHVQHLVIDYHGWLYLQVIGNVQISSRHQRLCQEDAEMDGVARALRYLAAWQV